ncbi:MAG: DUF669 domain-containing protein [Agitococcus sp.]|nr:DUF669 domain-containing protein [Agitococcus sp.]
MSNLAGYNFNAEEVEPSSSFDPIPAGWYTAIISSSEMKATRDGYGEYLSLTLQIIEGQYENRLVFARLNLKNANDKAVDIARKDLAAICRAVGVMSPQASEELHDKPLMIKVKVRPASGDYEASNDIGGYKAVEGANLTPAPKAASKPQTPPPAATKKPWQK